MGIDSEECPFSKRLNAMLLMLQRVLCLKTNCGFT